MVSWIALESIQYAESEVGLTDRLCPASLPRRVYIRQHHLILPAIIFLKERRRRILVCELLNKVLAFYHI